MTVEARQESRIRSWYRDTRAELSKVVWPTREEGIRLTVIVIIVTIISALAIFAIDSLFSALVRVLLGAF